MEDKSSPKPGTARPSKKTSLPEPLSGSQELRNQAEKKLSHTRRGKPAVPASEADTQRLLHELQVHQIELEVQNTELVRTRAIAETALRQYTELYDFAPVGYFTLSSDGTIQKLNLNAARLLGATRKELLNRRFGLFVSTGSRPVYNAFIEKVFGSGINQICELPFQREGQTPFWGRLEAVSKDGQDCQVNLVDITANKQAEEKIAQLNTNLEQRVEDRTLELRQTQEKLIRHEHLAALGQLAGGVSHELRTPLAVILNSVYYLKLIHADGNDEIREYLAIIEKETHNADKIVTDLLDFARVQIVDREPVPVSRLVQEILEKYPSPPTIKMALDIPRRLPNIYADPRQVQQILGNLVVNAYQAMSAGGTLMITARRRAGEVALAVRDTGLGISPDAMSKLFEPLFTTKIKGIGLGLAVSKKQAEANGGRIEVQSTLGEGATFTLYLPIKE